MDSMILPNFEIENTFLGTALENIKNGVSTISSPPLTYVSTLLDPDETLTGGQFLNGAFHNILIDTNAAPFTLNLPDAQSIYDVLSNGSLTGNPNQLPPNVGDVVYLNVSAFNSLVNGVSITGGTGVTIDPSATGLNPNSAALLRVVFTDVTPGAIAVDVAASP